MADIETLPANTRYFTEVAAPSTPSTGQGVLYAATDGTLHYLNDAATDLEIGSGGSGMTNPMTTAEDIIVGGASGTPARLAIGTEGQVLSVSSGAVAWAAASGSSSFIGASVYKSSDQTNLANGVFTKVTFDAADFDSGSIFDNANDRLVADRAGKWLCSGTLCFTGNTSASNDAIGKLMVNGDAAKERYFWRKNMAANEDNYAPFSIVFDLALNDYVELYANPGSLNNVVDIRSTIEFTTLQLTFQGS